jgi:moderate conductance mechanosensitive channel
MARSFASLQAIGQTPVVIGLELALVLVAAWALYAVATRALRRAGRTGSFAETTRALQLRVRNGLIATSLLLALLILGYNGWLLSRGIDVAAHTAVLATSISSEMWIRFAVRLGTLVAAVLGFLSASRIVSRLLASVEAAIDRSDHVKDSNKSLNALFVALNRAIINTGWMLLFIFACWLFGAPGRVFDVLLLAVRVYVIVAVGLMIVRSTVMIVDTLDAFGHRYAHTRGLLSHYDDLRPLVPVFRPCLEYALWIGLASLVLTQLGAFPNVMAWGLLLIVAIGMFFAGRVVIELGQREIGRRMLPAEGLDDTARRRRETIAPLVRSTFAYAVYFATAVLILGRLPRH